MNHFHVDIEFTIDSKGFKQFPLKNLIFMMNSFIKFTSVKQLSVFLKFLFSVFLLTSILLVEALYLEFEF